MALTALAVGLLAGSVTAQSEGPEGIAPVEVTGEIRDGGPCPVAPTEEVAGGVARLRGGYCNPTYTWSDRRLEGTVTWSTNEDTYLDGGFNLGSLAFSIENDAGGWRSRPFLLVEFPGPSASDAITWVLDGEGDYEGLFAVLEWPDAEARGSEVHGYIIEGDFPPRPENASTE
jgi:hypothetical protein